MRRTVTSYDFCSAFKAYNREDDFSYDGLKALYDYLGQYEDDCGCEVELDVISLCCEYSEYDSATTCIEECGYVFKPDEDLNEDEIEESCLKWLHDNTQVISFDSGIIIQVF